MSTATPVTDFDPVEARSSALAYATRAGIPAKDVQVVVATDFVTVSITERRRTVFLVLGGKSTMTVRASGTARIVFAG